MQRTDTCLWADRFDCDTGDLFALQNEITGRIAIELNIELIAAEAARPTVNPEALDYIFRGRAVRLRPNSRDVYALAVGTSARWRSTRGLSRRKACWRARSRRACSTA